MTKIVPFEIEHFDMMEIDENSHLRREFRQIYEDYPNRGPAFTLLGKNDQPLACGGIFIQRHGVGEIWMLTSRELINNPVSAVKAGRYVMERADRMNLHRVQATVFINDNRGRRYVEAFGFVFEGLLRKYGPDGSDYLLYARVK